MPVLATYMPSISQKRFKFVFSCSIQPDLSKNMDWRSVFAMAIGSPGRPLTSWSAQWRYIQSRPIRTSTTGLFATLGKFICWRCADCWVFSAKSKADIVPVSLVAVYAVTCSFSSLIRGFQLHVNRAFFKCFHLSIYNINCDSLSVLPCSQSSAATSALM